jgi:general secretion pathway protein D
MKIQNLNLKKTLVLALGICLCAALPVRAQFGGGGFGGFGGFGGGGGGGGNRGGGGGSSSSGSSSTRQYSPNGSVGDAVISIDPDTHNIVVIADEDTSEYVGQVISNLDRPKPQVLIKVVFLEVQENKAMDLGVQGSYTGGGLGGGVTPYLAGYITNYSIFNVTNISQSSGQTVTSVTPTITPTGLTPQNQSFNMANNFGLPQSLAGAAGNGGLYQILGQDFNATIQAIAQAGKAQVLSRPSILARDGQLAEIVVGQSVYLPSGVSFASVGSYSTTVPTINGSYHNVGIQLDVTPFIGANNLVQMIVQPQVTAIDTSTPGQIIEGGSIISSPVYAPNINTRSATTVVITPDGQTVVIGGLMSDTKADSESKIPLLGDIPVLGNLFKMTSHSHEKTELLMFLTPHIIQTPMQLAANTSKEEKSTLTPNSYSESDLDRFLDKLPEKPAKK